MKVIILSGIPGSGKSTYAKENFPDAIVLSTDNFFYDSNGNYNFEPSEIGRAHANCLRRFVRLASDSIARVAKANTVIIDNTNTTVAEIAPYYEVAAAFGHDVEIRTINPTMQTSWSEKRNIHGVLFDVCAKLRNQLVNRQLPEWWKHSFVEEYIPG